MGQRANLIIVQYGEYELFYSHWAANTLTGDLFWSPELATAFIRMQQQVDKETGWLDDIWAEGGAVVDWDNKVFLLFGGEDILWDVPLRRLYLKLLEYIWQGWTIKWAYEGIADLADYVNYPRSKVLSKYDDDDEYDLSPPADKSEIDIVGSVVLNDRSLKLFPIADDIHLLIESGAKLVNKIEQQKYNALNSLYLQHWTENFPKGGFHLDLSSRTLEFWIALDAPNIENRVRKNWAGWHTICHWDCFEFQLEKTRGNLEFPTPDDRTLRKNLEQILLKEKSRSSVDRLLQLSERERLKGNKAQISPWALRDDRIELNLARRREILDFAFKKVLKD